MPGKHAPDKLLARRTRALARGFIIDKDPDKKFVQVPASLAPRVKAIAASLGTQASHNALSGECHAYARQATRAARPLLDSGVYRKSMKQHDAANLAKHHWEPRDDMVSDSAPPSPPARCASPPPSGGCQMTDACTQTEVFSLRAVAPAFSPAAPAESQTHTCYDELYSVQNSTIALLTGRLDELTPSHRRIRHLERQLESLRTSLSGVVASKCASLKADMREELMADMRSETKALLRDVSDGFSANISDMREELMADMRSETKALLRDVSDGFSANVSGAIQSAFEPALTASLAAAREYSDALHKTSLQYADSLLAAPRSVEGPRGTDERSVDDPMESIPSDDDFAWEDLPPPPGARVRVTGLVKAPQLNGRLGTVLDGDVVDSRIQVLLDPSGEIEKKRIHVRLENLILDLSSSSPCAASPTTSSARPAGRQLSDH